MTETSPSTTNESATTANGAPRIVAKAGSTNAPELAGELLRADAGDVRAAAVMMDRSGAESIVAERVTMDRSGAKTLEAKTARLTNSGVMMLKGDHAVLQNSSAIVASAGEMRVVKSKTVALIAGQTTIEGDCHALIHVGPTDGCLRPVVDGRGAIGFGAAFALTLAALAALGRRLLGGR